MTRTRTRTQPRHSIVRAAISDLLPYVRSTRYTKKNPRVEAYKACQSRLASELRYAVEEQAPEILLDGRLDPTPYPFRVGLVVRCSITKRKRPQITGLGSGDFDNYLKTILDALVASKLVRDDAPPYFRGMREVDGRPSGVVFGESRRSASALVEIAFDVEGGFDMHTPEGGEWFAERHDSDTFRNYDGRPTPARFIRK